MKGMIPLGRGALVPVLAFLVACSESTGPKGPPLVITTTSLPVGTVGEPYAGGLNAEGGDDTYAWEVLTGSLPDGLELSVEDLTDDDVLITGLPQESETATVTLQVRSGDGQRTTGEFTIEIEPAPDPLTITSLRLPPALEGQIYAVRILVNGGAEPENEWALIEGALPSGVTLTADGVIQGTPAAAGVAMFTVRLRNGDEEVIRSYELEVVPHLTATFEITAFDVSRIPGSIRPHVDSAIAVWESVLIGDLGFVEIPTDAFGSNGCGGFGQWVNGTTVDDVLILVNIDSIDGPGSVLGQAGPCGTRSETGIPVLGILTLDSEDLRPLAGSNTLTDLLTHEIGHILGFGTIWDDMLDETNDGDPRFTGPQAVAQWQAAGGQGDVPVESSGGQGTAGSHWRESTFDDEIMTGFIEAPGTDNPMSRVTIGAFEDFGYSVNLDAAESASALASLLAPHGAASFARPNLGYDVVLRVPIRQLDTGAGGGIRR